MPRIPRPADNLRRHGSRKVQPVAGQIPPGRPVMPKWLPAPAKACWRKIVPILDNAGLLAAVDYGVVLSYCLATAEMQECSVIIARDGLMVESNGQKYAHPLLKVRAAAQQRIRALAVEMGLTAISRKRAHVETAVVTEEEDALDRFIRPRYRNGVRVPDILADFQLS